MQELTEELLDILYDHFQAGAQGYRAEFEIGVIVPASGGAASLVQHKHIGAPTDTGLTLDAPVTIGNVIVYVAARKGSGTPSPFPNGTGWTLLGSAEAREIPQVAGYGNIAVWAKVADSTSATFDKTGSAREQIHVYEVANVGLADAEVLFETRQVVDSTTADVDLGSLVGEDGFAVMVTAYSQGNDSAGSSINSTFASGWTEDYDNWADPSAFGDPWFSFAHGTGPIDAQATAVESIGGQSIHEWAGVAVLFLATAIDASVSWVPYVPEVVDLDFSRRMDAAQARIRIPRAMDDDSLLDVIPTNSRIRIKQWYGDTDNKVTTFTGLVDEVKESRDHRYFEITARDRMKILIEQNITVDDPQGEDEEDAVRTVENHVYLGMDALEILKALLDHAGWPEADRNLYPTSYGIDEYFGNDGDSYIDAIKGEDRLTGLTGYDCYANPLGILQWRPSQINSAADSDTDPVPVYSYVIGDTGSDNLVSALVLEFDHSIDEYDLRTRVKVRGGVVSAQAAWSQAWKTSTFRKPVGLWYRPSDPDFLYVLDRGTKKVYRLRQSDRDKVGTGIWPLDVSANADHPLGLSGDPADANVFWVLDAGWRTGDGDYGKVHKYNATTGAHVTHFNLPDGQWTDLKVSNGYLWLARYDTDRIYQRSKSDGSAIDSFLGPEVNGNVQDNPTGIGIDGTTLLTFWDGKARFLLTDESAPRTLDPSTPLLDGNGIIKMAGTKVFGGEMDTDTHAHLFACHDELGLVWKFNLTEPDEDAVTQEVADSDLEDELGALSGVADRVHDTHPGDDPHPFEIRRETISLSKLLDNVGQATETATRKMDEFSVRREVLDLGHVGNPGLEINDTIRAADPVTGFDKLYLLDTYRTHMEAGPGGRGYVGVSALLPYEATY